MVAEQQAEPRWKRAGPPYEMTREEIVAFLREQGYLVTERQLQQWATRGILPAATRKLPRGGGDGHPRAIYPAYLATVIRDLLDDATQGQPLAALQEAAPRYIELRRSDAGPDASPLKRVTAERSLRWRVEAAPVALAAIGAGGATGTATLTVTPRIARALSHQVLAYARQFAERNGTSLKRATLVVEGQDGQRLTLTLESDEVPLGTK